MSRPRHLPSPLPTLAFVATFLMTSCHSLPVSPAGSGGLARIVAQGVAPSPHVVDGGSASRVPVIRALKSEVRDNTLYLYGQFRPGAVSPAAFYDASRPGGWALQLFMNTDQASSGYPWRGIDYLVRGSERLTDGRFVVRRIERDSDDPGGWGPISGTARITIGASSFVLAVPLAAIGDDDGRLDFVIETYETVACSDRADGVSHLWNADYEGSSPTRAAYQWVAVSAPGVESLAAARRPGPSTSRTTSDTDARW